MHLKYSPDLVPHGVEILWNSPDADDPDRYITGANFHSALLQLNQEVDLSSHAPLTTSQAEQLFLASLGMTQPEQAAYRDVPESTVAGSMGRAYDKLGGGLLHHAIGRSCKIGIIEVVEPLVLPKPPSDETLGLVNVVSNYRTMQEAQAKERGNVSKLLGKTAAYYGLRGLYDFMTWAYATQILASSSPRFVPKDDLKPRYTPDTRDAFVWRRTSDGFTVNVFDEAQPCATLLFEGKGPRTAWLRDIVTQGGRIAVRNFFDTPRGRTYLSRGELDVLGISALGGGQHDFVRLGVRAWKRARKELYEKIGVPETSPPYGAIQTIARSFDQEIMTCEVTPRIMKMANTQHERILLLSRFVSHADAAEKLDTTQGSLRTLLSNATSLSPFPTVSGVHLVLRAAEEGKRRLLVEE